MKKQVKTTMLIAAILYVLVLPVIARFGVNAAAIQAATMMEALDKVNVRVSPDTGAEILGQLEQGDRLFAVELTEEGWYRVVYEGETGYIRSDFLKVYGAEEWDEPENPDATGPAGEVINPEEEVSKASEEAARKESESIEKASREAAAAAASSEAKVKEKAARKKRSLKINIGIFAGAVLLIAGYGVYTVIKEGKKTENAEEVPSDSEQEKEDDEIDYLNLE